MSRGKVLGDRYKIGEKIGSGGFSTVYFCVDLQAAVDTYLEDRRKEYEEYRLCFERAKAEERTSHSGKKGGGRGRKGTTLGNPVTFEELCGAVPSPEEVIHPDVLQALLTTGKVPMITSDAALYLGGRKAISQRAGTSTYPPTGTDKSALLSPTLYRSNSPAPSSLASSATSRSRNNNINLFQNANNATAMNGDASFGEPGVLIHWGRTMVPPVYAVKVLNKAQLKHLCMEDAFDREVEAMKAITRSQPSNCINVLDVLQSTRNYYLVMDLADQGSLLSVIVRNNATLTGGGGGGLPGPAARKYFRQLINGLSFVHGADVVHRDIKPENLLLDRWRDVRISDFGFAAYSPPGRMLTRPCGTPQYAAPEVLVDNPRYDGRKVDMWSTGITLFVIAFGCLPFYANTNEKLYNKITRGVYEIPTTLRKPPPPSLIHLLSVLLDTNPKSRWSVEMVRVHPWVLGRDDIPERLQHSYLLSVKKRYMLEKRKADRSGGKGRYLASPVENDDNPLTRKTSSLPAASDSFLALTSAAGIDPTKVHHHLHQQPMLGRSIGSDASSTDQHEQEMEALMMELGDELNDDDFLEGTDGYLFVQQHRRNIATVTQASSSCPNLRQIQGGFVVDGGRSKETGNNQLHRGEANTPPTDGIQSGNNSAFFTVEPSADFCVPSPAAAEEAMAEEYSNAGDDSPRPQTVVVQSMGSAIHSNSMNISGGGGGASVPRDGAQNNQQSSTEFNTFRGSHLLDMLEHSIGDGSITVDVETGLLVLLDGLDMKQRIRLQKAAEKALEENPGVEVTRYAKVLTPLLAHFDRIHDEEQQELNGAGESATGWGSSESAIGYPATPGTTAANTQQNSVLSSTSCSPAIQDLTVHKRYPPGKHTPPLNHHSRSDSFSNTRYSLEGPGGSKSSTPSSRPQSTPGARAGRGSVSGGTGEATPEDIKNREKRPAFRRLGLLHIQIVLNFIAVFAIIFVAGTAKVLFDVDVAKWPMPAFLRRFIDRILSPPKQASASTTGGSSSGTSGFSTSRSSPGGNFNHHHTKNSPGMDSTSMPSSSYNRATPNWSHSPSSAALNSFGSSAGHQHHHPHHQRQPSTTSYGSTPHLSTSAGVMGSSRHQRTPSNTKTSLSDTPRPLETQPPNSNEHAPRLLRPPSTFTLSSTPLTTSSTIPIGRSPGQLPHTNSPSTGIQFPASEPPTNLGCSLNAPSSTLLRPKPTRKHSNLSSASSDDAPFMPRTMTAQHSDPFQADPLPAGSSRLLQPTAVLLRSPIGSDSIPTEKRLESDSPGLNSHTFIKDSSFHSGELHNSCNPPPPLSLPTDAVIRQGVPLQGSVRGGLKKSDGSSASPTASPILKRVKLSASAYRRSGVLDEDLPEHVDGVLADEDATNQQGFKPSQQSKMGLQKMKRIDSHVALGGRRGGGDLADMDDVDMSLAT